MIRSAKTFYNLDMARKALAKIGKNPDDFDLPVCHLDGGNLVETSKCVTWCKRPCFHFLNFEFITNNCSDDSCSSEFPCAVCLGRIDDQKMWVKMVIACYTPFVHSHKTHHKASPSGSKYKTAKKIKLMRRKS